MAKKPSCHRCGACACYARENLTPREASKSCPVCGAMKCHQRKEEVPGVTDLSNIEISHPIKTLTQISMK